MLALKVENLSKQYRLGEIGTGTLSHDLNRLWAKLRGKEDPFAQIGVANDRTQKANSDYVWSLKDINFEVEQGDAVGIIGRNGAGKSTLLKILSRTTLPTTGSVKIKGRIASLLEVGTGFHPEMTGRENIYQNGALLGMTRSEIKRKFDEIVDFSGCEAYIDTPVKRYSSGMYVRLAFAVAAHLESEILIVDEVLAVGDAEFQKKCLGKMNDVAKGEGRTVLFVSHNMAAVKSLCNKGILLDNGSVRYKNNAENVIDYYLSNANNLSYESLSNRRDRKGNGLIKVKEIRLLNKNAEYVNQVISGETLTIRFFLEKNKDFKNYDKLFFGVNIINNEEIVLTSYLSDEMDTNTSIYMNQDYIDLFIPNFNFRGGLYSLNFQIGNGSTKEKDLLDYLQNAFKIEVLASDFWQTRNTNRNGDFLLLEGLFK